jgi:hypothetical protein
MLSSKKLSGLAEDLLSNPLFAQAFASALQKGLETKGAFDRNVANVLWLLNLPSRNDLGKLLTKLDVLQGRLANLEAKVDKLVAAEKRRRRAARGAGDASA